MIIHKHVTLLVLLLIGVQQSHCQREYQLRLWKNYGLDSQVLAVSHSYSPHAVWFKDRVQADWSGEYQFSDEKILMEFKRNEELLQVIGIGDSLLVRGLKQGETVKISQSMLSDADFSLVLLKDGVAVDAKIASSGEVVVQGFNELAYLPKDATIDTTFSQQKASVIAQSQQKLAQFFSFYKINETHLPFGQAMLSKTFSQLCKEEVKQLSFIGVCYNIHEGKRHNPHHRIDIRYSALIIDRLFPIYPNIALFLFQDLFSLIEDTIFYADSEFVEIPEHIEVVQGFIAALKKTGTVQGKLLSTVKSVLNGLMNQMLLSDVNALEEEINYRENKKMHPTLVKMLSLKWKSHSRKNALSSIYQESFTPDYFYNHAHQHTDTCVSKVAWLTAAAAEFVLLVKTTGNKDDIDALEQPTSLFKILQQVTHSDSHAKQGRYYSVNQAEGVRLYAQQIGYESFLPYTYELTSLFPQEFLRNVTTSFGLASLNLNHPKSSEKFEFRGNVHLYFNYKILLEARRRIESSKNQRPLPAINDLIARLQSTVLSFWQTGRHFTVWTAGGVGLRERKGLAVLSVLVLGERR